MMEESDKFKEMLQKFNDMKYSLIQQAKRIEEVFDRAHSKLSPTIVSKTICYIAKYRFEKDISLEHIFSSLAEKLENESFNYDPDHPFRITCAAG